VEDESADWLSRVYRESAASLAWIPDKVRLHHYPAISSIFFDPQAFLMCCDRLKQLLSPRFTGTL
jgi:hypothetical protein